MTRTATLDRRTTETAISGRIDLDGNGASDIATGLGFLDHMVVTLAKHSGFDLELSAAGDITVDDHHTVEDCAIVMGRGIAEALGDRAGIQRFGYAYAALDESLVRSVVDLSGRPWPEVHLNLARDRIGDVATENIVHFFRTLAIEGRMALHVDLIRGDNDHHRAEAAFKATALALKSAVEVTGIATPSTKGTLT
ncbi:MAG: imidazoleglycerol-phosphate dehydratase HisB [Actinomycetota bacterium]|nr:imidazoleglycerol-phosphate dehydratase HisB [Actinomycetota bacterium]